MPRPFTIKSGTSTRIGQSKSRSFCLDLKLLEETTKSAPTRLGAQAWPNVRHIDKEKIQRAKKSTQIFITCAWLAFFAFLSGFDQILLLCQEFNIWKRRRPFWWFYNCLMYVLQTYVLRSLRNSTFWHFINIFLFQKPLKKLTIGFFSFI